VTVWRVARARILLVRPPTSWYRDPLVQRHAVKVADGWRASRSVYGFTVRVMQGFARFPRHEGAGNVSVRAPGLMPPIFRV
jgi:hypothetical protein